MKGFWAGYFANRAAPLGPVNAGTVTAAFFNFHPGMVARAIPLSWDVVAPAELVVLRAAAASEALGAALSADAVDALRTTLPVLREAVAQCGGDGRVLTGANRALPGSLVSNLRRRGLSEVEVGLAEAWQACTTLREHRGDGHVAALVCHELSGLEAHLLVSATEGSPAEILRDNRGWSEQEWRDGAEELWRRGLLHDDGRATTVGFEIRRSVESLTDRLARPPFATMADGEVTTLHSALLACARQIQGSGLYPFPNPMGLPALP